MAIDIQAVTRAIEEAANTLVMPRFSRLASHEIEAKGSPEDPEDIVTIVDRDVEAFLSDAFAAIDPSAAVVGEESAYQRPELLGLLAGAQPLWIIDPVDGTKNFAAGDSGFGIMVSYVVEGRAQAAWVVLPARRQSFVAESGGGAFLNDERIHVRTGTPPAPLQGSVLARYMPDGLGKTIVDALDERVQVRPSSGCAAVEYADALLGARDFTIYYRLLPWDHAAPALILTEAGGCVVHLSGQPYTARSADQPTIVARHRGVADQLRAWLRGL